MERVISWCDDSLSQADGYSEGKRTTITVNTFALRHKLESKYSHYTGSEDDLLQLVADNWEKARPSFREGVLSVPVDPQGFFTSIVELTPGATLSGAYKPRREGEKPRKEIGVVSGSKLPAARVDIILYNSKVLAEDGDNELPIGEDDCWEVISINASPDLFETPINPNTLIYNHFGLDGGTRTTLTDEQFIAQLKESFIYWSNKALLAEAEEK